MTFVKGLKINRANLIDADTEWSLIASLIFKLNTKMLDCLLNEASNMDNAQSRVVARLTEFKQRLKHNCEVVSKSS